MIERLKSLIGKLEQAMQSGLSLSRDQVFNPSVLIERITADLVAVLLACLPLAGLIMLVALASPLLIGGWNFSSKAFVPNFMKLDPIKGIGNMFSTNALIELLKAVAQTVDDFATDNISMNNARDWMSQRFGADLDIDASDVEAGPRLVPRSEDGADAALARISQELQLAQPVNDLSDHE